MNKIAGWQSALSLYLVEVAHKPFAYGDLDCGLFVADAVLAMTGVDVAAELRGKYSSRVQAFARIRELAGRPTMEAIGAYLAGRFFLNEVGILRAERGDPILLRSGRASRLGIVAMHGTEILTPSRNGILRLPLSHATRAWHIGA